MSGGHSTMTIDAGRWTIKGSTEVVYGTHEDTLDPPPVYRYRTLYTAMRDDGVVVELSDEDCLSINRRVMLSVVGGSPEHAIEAVMDAWYAERSASR